MLELGELEEQHAEFTKRNVQVVVASNDDVATARLTQEKFPNLIVVADPDLSLINAMQVQHAGAAPGGTDTAAPTTFLFDGTGHVCWFVRPDRITDRLPPEQILKVIDQTK